MSPSSSPTRPPPATSSKVTHECPRPRTPRPGQEVPAQCRGAGGGASDRPPRRGPLPPRRQWRGQVHLLEALCRGHAALGGRDPGGWPDTHIPQALRGGGGGDLDDLPGIGPRAAADGGREPLPRPSARPLRPVAQGGPPRPGRGGAGAGRRAFLARRPGGGAVHRQPAADRHRPRPDPRGKGHHHGRTLGRAERDRAEIGLRRDPRADGRRGGDPLRQPPPRRIARDRRPGDGAARRTHDRDLRRGRNPRCRVGRCHPRRQAGPRHPPRPPRAAGRDRLAGRPAAGAAGARHQGL